MRVWASPADVRLSISDRVKGPAEAGKGTLSATASAAARPACFHCASPSFIVTAPARPVALPTMSRAHAVSRTSTVTASVYMHGLRHQSHLLLVEPDAVGTGGPRDLQEAGLLQVLDRGAAGQELPRLQRLALQAATEPSEPCLLTQIRL